MKAVVVLTSAPGDLVSNNAAVLTLISSWGMSCKFSGKG